MSNERLYILFLDTGFKYDIEDTYKKISDLLSKYFDGKVVTYGEEGDYKFGSILIKVFKIYAPKRFLIKFRWPIHKLVMTFRSLFYAILHVWKRKLQGKKVDLIVTYDPLTTGFMGVIVSKLTNTPLIVEINGDYTALSNYDHIKNKKLKHLKRKLGMTLESFVLKHSSGIRILYESQIDAFKHVIKNQEVRVISYYLDVSNFRNISERKTISLIGFPFMVKGVDIAIAAFKVIADKFPEWSLEILGFYPPWEQKRLQKHIDGHKQIKHLKPIMRHDMPEYIGNTGIVLCASRTEGFPRVIKEAMYSSKPCIASNVGGLDYAFENNTNGYIFESENIQQLSALMVELMSDETKRKELGESAFKYATDKYTDDAFIEQAQSFYHAVKEKNS